MFYQAYKPLNETYAFSFDVVIGVVVIGSNATRTKQPMSYFLSTVLSVLSRTVNVSLYYQQIAASANSFVIIYAKKVIHKSTNCNQIDAADDTNTDELKVAKLHYVANTNVDR